MLGKPHVTAPLVGIGREDHLYEMISSLSLKLSDQEVKYLEELYIPHKLIPM
jgi:aryl-alcohol dehydrogenase-like predicted oxidoreductase